MRENPPPSADVGGELGSLFVKRNDPVAARSAFTKALSLASTSSEALAGLVGLDLASKNEAAAIGRLEARLREEPGDGRMVSGVSSVPQAEESGAGGKRAAQDHRARQPRSVAAF